MMYGALWLVLLGCPWISVEEHQANMFPTGWTDTADTWDTTTTDPTSTTPTTTTSTTTGTTTTSTTSTTTGTTTTGTTIPSPCGGPAVRFNEVMSRNEDWADPAGNVVNWLEVVEANGDATPLNAYTVVSYEQDATRFWSFSPGTLLPEGGHLVVWGEGGLADPNRAPFEFSAARGGEIALFDPDGCELDRVMFPPMWTPYSYGRIPSRTGDWQLLDSATPNGPNLPGAADVGSCLPDAYQMGDLIYSGYPLEAGESELYGTTCEDEKPYGGLSLLVDFYSADLAPDEVMTVRLLDGLNTACVDSEFSLIALPGEDPSEWVWTSPENGCPEMPVYRSDLVGFQGVGVLAPLGYGDQDYFLEWEVASCTDTDGDGFLDDTCGGNDCAPTNASIYPGASENFALTGGVIDRDCDGVVLGESCFAHDETDPWMDPTFGSVASLSPVSWKSAYDIYSFDVNAGDCVIIQTDILQTFGPNLSLWANEGGIERLGDRFTEELACSRPTWSKYSSSCPRGNFVASQTGSVQIAIGQETGFGPNVVTPTEGFTPEDGQYMVQVYVNGLPQVIDLVADDRVAGAYTSPF